MPWCPKCKSEYVDGIVECADCKVPLVEELPEESEPSLEEYDMENIEEEALEEDIESEEEEKRPTYAGAYQNKKDKAADFLSSAYTLLIVGGLGLVALVLIEMGMLPIRLSGPGRYMTYIVMGALFVIFIVCGIFSFRSAKKYEAQSDAEIKQTEEIKKWAMERLDIAQIKSSLAQKTEQLPEEMKYFAYFERVKEEIRQQFDVSDEAYLDALVEELYPSLFETEQNS